LVKHDLHNMKRTSGFSAFAKGFLLCLAICVSSNAIAAMESTRGKIFYPEESLDTPFTYLYEKSVKGADTIGKTQYFDSSGKVVIEEETVYEDGKFRLYKYHQLQTNEKGTVEIKGKKVFYHYTSEGKTYTEEDDVEERMIVPDMVVDTYRDSWDELMKDESVYVRFLLLERQESIGFKFFKERDLEYEGKSAVELIMKPSSFIIAALAPKIRLIVEKNPPHRLLEMRGRLPVRIAKVNPPKKRNDWRAIDGRLVIQHK
jgi:hypothetical protein